MKNTKTKKRKPPERKWKMQIRCENWAERRRAITIGSWNNRSARRNIERLLARMIQWLKIKLLCFRLKFHEVMRNWGEWRLSIRFQTVSGYCRIMITHRGTVTHFVCGFWVESASSKQLSWLFLSFLTKLLIAFSLQAASASSIEPFALRYCSSLLTLAFENMY